jgi:formiminotetrahydrofolate cyclodeaminase
VTDGLGGLSLGELLDQLGAATPAPGGGSASALACGLAAGLVEMAAGFGARAEASDGQRELLQRARSRGRELRARAVELADLELHAYAPVLEALRLPASDPDRPRRLQRALAEASRVPLEIAAIGAELAGLAAEAVSAGSRYLEGDAVTAAVLAEAGCRSAAGLVQANLGKDRTNRRLLRAAEYAREAAAARDQALAARSHAAERIVG